jgi:succinate dehydrogenase/fumarate reductase flavoprotein subunit
MEFVQFFPIGHLAPRLIGMDPIMWDPFRYKLGGRLLNSEGREFIGDYHFVEEGRYKAPRDVATHAILKEVAAGRGSPSGGAYLSFQHIPAVRLRESFGPVIDRLAANGIDLTKQPVEVAPIAHYHMGGVRVVPTMETRIARLFAGGEAVGGANGANRLSGNAIPEALVFGRQAGIAAARCAKDGLAWRKEAIADTIDLIDSNGPEAANENPANLLSQLQSVMTRHVGPIRNRDGLQTALREIVRIGQALGSRPPAVLGPYDMRRLDWFDMRNMLLVAESVIRSALTREESRGAHQRDDFPENQDAWTVNQTVTLKANGLALGTARAGVKAAEATAE